MDERDLYAGFDLAKQQEYEEYLVRYHGNLAEDLIHESQKRKVEWGSEEWSCIKEEGN